MSQAAPHPVVRNHRRLFKLWSWSHDNPLTLLWISAFNIVGWVVTVVTCR